MAEKIRKAYPINPARAHKFHAQRENGYASKRESARAGELRLLANAGIISDLKEQVAFDLLPATKDFPRPLRYVADFTFMENGKQVIADAKGVLTPEYRIKKRLMRQLLGLEITEI